MSAKNAKLSRNVVIKARKKISNELIRQLFAAPWYVRIMFAFRVIFKR